MVRGCWAHDERWLGRWCEVVGLMRGTNLLSLQRAKLSLRGGPTCPRPQSLAVASAKSLVLFHRSYWRPVVCKTREMLSKDWAFYAARGAPAHSNKGVQPSISNCTNCSRLPLPKQSGGRIRELTLRACRAAFKLMLS